jgi:hypothetical protein
MNIKSLIWIIFWDFFAIHNLKCASHIQNGIASHIQNGIASHIQNGIASHIQNGIASHIQNGIASHIQNGIASTKCCWFLFRLMSFFISIFFENLNYMRHWQKLMWEQRTITMVDIVDVNLTTIQWRPGQSLYIRTLKLFHFHLE